MPKIALITDLHIGARSDNPYIAAIQKEFYFKKLFPDMGAAKIDDLFCLGDFFDKRQHVSLKSMTFAAELESEMMARGITFTTLVGNHDTLYRDTNKVNSLTPFFRQSCNVQVIEDVAELGLYNILMVPWINPENTVDALDAIATSKMKYCFGHFSIEGFEFHKGTVCEHGLKDSLFNRFELAMSGHFHTRSSKGNIVYLGSPYEMSWSDYCDPRGYHIFDTDTGDLEFVPFETSLFFTIEYHADGNKYAPYEPETLEGKFVKIIVKSKDSAYDYDVWLKSIQSQNPADIQIIEAIVDVEREISLTEDEIKSQIKGNLDVIRSYVDGLDTIDSEMKQRVRDELVNLYNEANAV